MVAIVGTREASSYGLRVAKAFGRAFAESGAVVVSGMARGVDTAAHEGALEGGGKTVAVLGTGPDVPYPAWNRGLHEVICNRGLVLSESAPGTKAFQGCFPKRNRIIAALSRATFVVEAGFKSGALNTASQALELGRVIGAVPGPIDHQRSMGSNQLLRDGAQVLTSVDDALTLLQLSRNKAVQRPELGEIEADIWQVLGEGEVSQDSLAARLEVPIRDLLAGIANLEVIGLVSTGLDGMVSRSQLGVEFESTPDSPPSQVREGPRPRPSRRAQSTIK